MEERTIEQQCQQAKIDRPEELNRFLVDLFIETPTFPPQRIVLDIDTTDDSTHGGQQLSLFHGDYQQHQDTGLLDFDGETKFPLCG